MKISFLIGGQAGVGINVLARIISAALAREGFFVFNYRDYGSLIRGGNSFNLITFSDKEIYSQEEKIDFLLAFDKLTYELHKNKLKEKGVIATNNKELASLTSNDGLTSTEGSTSEKFFYLDTSKYKQGNMAFAGFLFNVIGLSKEAIIEEMKIAFQGKNNAENEQIVSSFYEQEYNLTFEIKKQIAECKKNNENKEQTLKIINGSEAIVQGALDSGLDFYFGYPMTPATGVLTLLSQEQNKISGKLAPVVMTPESEIGVINMALGASFAGRRVMVGTSGGGFDLMTEGLSLQGMMELPLVIHLAQRIGAATGVPTYTGQGDLNVALYGGHGEFSRIVVAPGDPAEAYENTRQAFYLSEKFGVGTIILTDKHVLESDFTQNLPNVNLEIPQRKQLLGADIIKKNSYEHDSAGNTTEDSQVIKESFQKREEREENIKKECKNFTQYKIFGSGQNLIISFGSNKGAIIDALKELQDFKFLHLVYLQPFPEEVRPILDSAKKILVIESNSTAQLSQLIRKELAFPLKKEDSLLKFDGRPWTMEELVKVIKDR